MDATHDMLLPSTEIRLYGPLGAKFGRVHKMLHTCAADGVRALCAMVPGFERELTESQDKGLAYAIYYDKDAVPEEGLMRRAQGRVLRIAPIIRGRKSGIFQAVLGVALIAASFYAPYLLTGTLGGTVTFGMASSIGSGLFALGSAMALGAASQLFTKNQAGLSTKDGPDNGTNYNMNGTVNTTAQGNVVPVMYGYPWSGSVIASAGVFNEDEV